MGYERRKLAKQSASFVWNGFFFCDTSKKESKGDKGRQEELVFFISFRLKRSEIPMFQLCAAKSLSRVILVHSFSDVHIYTYVYICLLSRAILTVAIASR